MTSNPPFDDAATAAIPGVPHRWTALTIALTVIGFIVFWPLGLAMIAYVLWGEKIAATARGSAGAGDWFKKTADDFGRNIRKEFSPKGFYGVRQTGNAAFDAWRASELARIEDERRKLDETTAAFEAHLRAERGAHDEGRAREEFERFMSERRAG
ncbi:DUF2852 domain-containing protein [Hansschlegelia quercus]|uniref:DUF2852 domain-containing protein n=1 Tax=Hansschlegelia quercus TaxID=2528245 RepID=A0A4Q9GAK8_9HYPH|nr:DUF2852 domain-containing protein [Hansschlegelia quercus]TBN47928.1 DUF2852 domain-containing protein [Hansschlegelia quercus]